MRKTFLFIFAAVCALCVSLSLTFAINTSVVRAETVSGVTPTLSSTKYLKSTDGTTMLLATGIKDYQDCYECGYVTFGADAVKYDVTKYYESITLKKDGKEKTWRAEDLFSGYDAMIVWEVESTAYATSFQAYVRVGDREDGVLVDSDKIVYGNEKEVVTHASKVEITEAYIHSTDFSQENFKDSGKALTFEYKAVDNDNNGGNDIQFTIWTYDWTPRITELVTVDVVNNTVSGAAGKVEDVGDGWNRVTINCSDMPIATGATGTETAGLLYFNIVNHAFLFDNVGFTDEDIHIGAETFDAGTAKFFYFTDNYSTSGVDNDKIAVFDVKFTSGSDTMLYFVLREYWNGAYYGFFTVYANGTCADNGVTTEDLGDGWYRVRINLAKANKGSSPKFASRLDVYAGTTGSGYVKYIGSEDPDIHEDAVAFTASTQKDYYFVENYTTSGVALDKIIKIDVKFESEGIFYFYLNESWNGKYCGLYALTSAGVLSGSGAVSAESIDDGWYRIYIDLGKATKTNNPAFISRINIAAATSASGYVMYMGYDEPEIVEPDIHEGATAFSSSAENGYYFITPSDNGEVSVSNTIAFDVQFTSGAGTKITFLLREYFRNRYFGYYSVFKSGTLGGTYPGVTTEVLEDGWIRIKINLSEATWQGNAAPSFVSRIEIKATTTGSDYTTASGYIKYMGIVE